MLYVEVLKKHYNNVGRTFCDAISICRTRYRRALSPLQGGLSRLLRFPSHLPEPGPLVERMPGAAVTLEELVPGSAGLFLKLPSR